VGGLSNGDGNGNDDGNDVDRNNGSSNSGSSLGANITTAFRNFGTMVLAAERRDNRAQRRRALQVKIHQGCKDAIVALEEKPKQRRLAHAMEHPTYVANCPRDAK
jgi:hypothetical protein